MNSLKADIEKKKITQGNTYQAHLEYKFTMHPTKMKEIQEKESESSFVTSLFDTSYSGAEETSNPSIIEERMTRNPTIWSN